MLAVMRWIVHRWLVHLRIYRNILRLYWNLMIRLLRKGLHMGSFLRIRGSHRKHLRLLRKRVIFFIIFKYSSTASLISFLTLLSWNFKLWTVIVRVVWGSIRYLYKFFWAVARRAELKFSGFVLKLLRSLLF